MGLRKILCGIFDCQAFKDHDLKLDDIGAKVVEVGLTASAILAVVQAGLVASPLTWWIQDPGSVTEELFSLQLMVKGSQLWEFSSYGAEVVFDPAALTLTGIDRGDLNADWLMEGENEIEPGRWRFAGIPGDASPITGEVTGSISVFHFTKAVGFSGETEIRIENAVDDFEILSPQPLIFNLVIE